MGTCVPVAGIAPQDRSRRSLMLGGVLTPGRAADSKRRSRIFSLQESGHMVTVVLPWPPSVNSYWRSYRGRNILSKRGRLYKEAAGRAVLAAGANRHLSGRLRVKLVAYPPDNRRRDLDNLAKGVLDSMQGAGVYLDDSQVDELIITRAEVERGGVVVATVETVGPARRAQQSKRRRT